ncbi:Protein CBR-SRG-40 [Caenorhabditis briggsae]|uniref:Serpentine receptor class gamma n=1 Tax=Caenorhabditis briggsae TaxID=6238 RepID=A8Y4N0_CAEBR|nr:Protein CBR-SRG-40 [Caenorhabditis briggsae]CAP39850.2 Protein CBR-SRG-40 [Caenorhabditis briggsae]
MLSAGELFCVYLSYGIPSFVIYMLTFFIIFRYGKTFSSSFFRLYLFDGALNLLTYFNNYFKTRLPGIACHDCLLGSFYRSIGNTFLMDIFMLMNFHMAYVQYAVTTLVSLNRLTVIVKYTLFEPPINDVFSVCIPFMVAFTVISVVVNIVSVFIIRNLKTQIKNKAETNFIIITCITCAVQLCGTSLSFIRVKYSGTPAAVKLASFIPFISDGLSLIQPWLLICISHVVREKITELIYRKNQPQVKSVVIPRSTLN